VPVGLDGTLPIKVSSPASRSCQGVDLDRGLREIMGAAARGGIIARSSSEREQSMMDGSWM